jgi:hypothetical protein
LSNLENRIARAERAVPTNWRPKSADTGDALDRWIDNALRAEDRTNAARLAAIAIKAGLEAAGAIDGPIQSGISRPALSAEQERQRQAGIDRAMLQAMRSEARTLRRDGARQP